MDSKTDAYQVIAEMWTFPSQKLRKMIEAMFTLEEAN